ncbi:MAG: IS1182 family transposase [Lachnospiraceae bacterium]|nr:IS1182 family transposase [Lachnospiraceae bacterium]
MLRNTGYEQPDLFQQLSYHRIPKNHILLRIDSEISLVFVNDLLASKYNKAFGRPAWKPEIMIRIGILQRMYDLSDEAVIDEIAVNRAYESFCHLSIMDPLPDPSSLCKFRKMRLDENTMDEIMEEIVRQMIEKEIIKMESGIVIDSTHINANTVRKVPERLMKHMAKNIFRETAEQEGLTEEEVEEVIKEKAAELPKWEEYDDHLKAKNDMKSALEEVISQADPNLESVREAREVLESSQFIEQKGIRSLQDKDARVGRKDHTTSFFGYKSEFMMTEEGIITGMTVQPGNYRDGDCFKELLDKTIRSGITPNAAYGDKAYCRPDVLKETKDLGIEAYIPVSHSAYQINEERFSYNKDSDTWTCVNGNESGTGKRCGKGKRTRIDYHFERECCRNCPYRKECIGKTTQIAKVLSVGTNVAELYEHSQFTKSEEFLERYKVRARIEPKNSEMKRFHGMDRANGYGLQSVLLQAFFTAIAVNLKRMIALKG